MHLEKYCWLNILARECGVSEQVGTEMLSIFIPTTPNPTSGFLMMVAQSDVLELTMTIDEALKFIISLGMMQPVDPAAFELRI